MSPTMTHNEKLLLALIASIGHVLQRLAINQGASFPNPTLVAEIESLIEEIGKVMREVTKS